MIAQLSLRAKLWVLTSVALVALFSTVVVGIVTGSSLSRSASDLSEKYLSTMLVLAKARNTLATTNSAVFKFTNEIRAGQTEQGVKQKVAEVQAELARSVTLAQEADAAMGKVALLGDDEKKSAIGKLTEVTEAYRKKLIESLDVIVTDVSVGGMMLMTTEEDYDKAAKTFSEAEKSIEQAVLAKAADAVKLAADTRRFLLLAGGIGFLVLTVISALIIAGIRTISTRCIEFTNALALGDVTHSIQVSSKRDEFGQIAASLEAMQQSLRLKANAAIQIARGNLDSEIRCASDRDELGISLVEMRDGLRDMIKNVMSSFQVVATEMAKLQLTSGRLRDASQGQAASIEQVSASLAEISHKTRQNAENTQNAAVIVGKLSTNAKSSQSQMTDLSRSMAQVQNSSKSVSNVIKAIDDIAFQTNLLALNASVEAARAGKHGKGFAVVADEVRGLASRAAKATGESSELIEGSLEAVSTGMKISEEAIKGYVEVFRGIESASAQILLVNAASTEQLSELTEATQAVGQIGATTAGTASFAEEVADAASQVSIRTQEVSELLSRFRL